jgi:hygromycin-B 4-O-kinase
VLLGSCPEERKLVHGDFGSNNVLVDGTAVTAVIDWDNAMYGDPLYDIATTHFWAPWLRCMQIADDYWQKELAEPPAFRERVQCYALHLGLIEFVGHSVPGQARMLAWLESRCRGLLDEPR